LENSNIVNQERSKGTKRKHLEVY